jgi:hypothetical protein
LLEHAFNNDPGDIPYFECPLPHKEQSENLCSVKPLIFTGVRTLLNMICSCAKFFQPAQIILSRISGYHSIHTGQLPFWIVPLYLYMMSRIDGVVLEEGRGVHVEAKGTFSGKAIVLMIIPTHFEGQFDPPAISPPWPPLRG